MTGCPRGNVGINTSKPLGLSVDDALWSEFAQKIDPLARMLNRGLLVATTILFAVAIAFVITNMVVMTSIVSLFPVIIGVIVVIGITLAFVLHVQNPKVDKLIEEVIAEFRPRFGEKGHKIEYLTQFNGTCRPKGARSERVISSPSRKNFVLHVQNPKVDKLIEEVIAEFRPRFGEKGHKIEYLTQFTGTCKPKGARSERVIVFPIMQETVVEAGNAQGDSTPTTQTKDEEDVPSASLFDKMKEENASS
eukprot:CAMPEP_0183327112 /NCGR_PEP_ID=MMETSP0160_2-20130417/83593_1 /TAXON_ID=2839 ORGANISM="Odontella Sinensis, Strain Grunow 1884" /NCGR_SAMPLE_ID=MMETSP0160_2 /ASSEMBLY_ACC=CAM_ASM_000250 /LENGTH=248 /DNA_ID=CAMNT_0025495225 /DNA_START=104 /DNA_END=851 /DNA_ORIENTATION=-